MLAGGPRKISPFFVPGSIINMIAGQLSIMYGLKGPNLAHGHRVHDRQPLHRRGRPPDRVRRRRRDDRRRLRGHDRPLGVGGFCAPRALSTRNDDPATASRPWDKDRDGFVLGEGAGVLVLEEYEHARARGARIYCELAGYGMSADAHHITAPCEDGEGAARCMANALRNARLNPTQVDYINAHGTSTPLGDIAETVAVKRCFGEHARKLAISSTKSMTGHLLGAAGGVEAVFSVLAMHRQVAPPTDQPRQPRSGVRPRLRAAARPARCRSVSPCRTPSASAAPTAR